MSREEPGTLLRRKLELSLTFPDLLTHALVQHLQQARRHNIDDPVMKGGYGREVLRQRRDLAAREVNQQSFRDDEDVVRGTTERGEKLAARSDIGQIEAHAIENAGRLLATKNLLFVIEDSRQIDFDPMKRCWQIHSIGTRVEAGSQVDDHIHALPDLLNDEFVVCISACDPGPRCALAERHGFRDLVAALACEAPREQIAENGIGPFRFAGAVNGREERGIGNIADEGIAGAHSDSLPRFRSLSDSAIGLDTLLTSYSSSTPFALLLVSGPCQTRGIQSQHRVAGEVDRKRNPAFPLRREELANHRIA